MLNEKFNDQLRKMEILRQQMVIVATKMKEDGFQKVELLLDDLHSIRGRFMQLSNINYTSAGISSNFWQDVCIPEMLEQFKSS